MKKSRLKLLFALALVLLLPLLSIAGDMIFFKGIKFGMKAKEIADPEGVGTNEGSDRKSVV